MLKKNHEVHGNRCKRFLKSVFALMFVIIFTALLGTMHETKVVSASNDEFVINDGILVDYKSNNPKVVIPSTVKEIGDGAFRKSTFITSVTIPNSVEKIGDEAFIDCKIISSITIPESVTVIGKDAFAHCDILKEVKILGPVEEIKDRAFSGCTALCDLTIGEGTLCIGNSAFENCFGLKNLDVPASVKNIRSGAFESCKGLLKVRITQYTDNIAPSAFSNCNFSKMCFYGYPDTVAYDFALKNGSNFSNYFDYMGTSNELNVIDKAPAKGATFKVSSVSYTITKATSKKSTKGAVAYKAPKNKKVTSVTIPATVSYKGYTYKVTSIASKALKDCKKLKTVTIKSTSLTSIGKSAFTNIYKKAKIKLPKSKKTAYKKMLKSSIGYKKTMKVSYF